MPGRGRGDNVVPMNNTLSADTVRINPSSWSSVFRFDQAQLRSTPHQILTLAGQGPVDGDGQLLHPNDPSGQIAAAMDNVTALLAAGGMSLVDVLRMVIYVTDMEAALGGYHAIVERLDAAGASPPATLVEVSRLAIPGMTVEIEITAGR